MEKQYLIFVTAFAFWFGLSLIADWKKRNKSKCVVARTALFVQDSWYWTELVVLYTNYNPANAAHNKQIAMTERDVVFDTKEKALEYIKRHNFKLSNEIKLKHSETY